MEVFIDESGDLGFTPKSTKYFVVAFLYISDTRLFRDAFRWLYLRLKRRHRYFHNELHFSQSNDTVRRKGLQLIFNSDECNFGIIAVNKKWIRPGSSFYDDANGVYRYVIVHNVMTSLIPKLNYKEKLNIILDKSLPQSQRILFKEYAELKGYYVSQKEGKKDIFYRDRLRVYHRNSIYEPCLQAADFLAGAEFLRFEHHNYAYHNIIKDKISEFVYWPPKP